VHVQVWGVRMEEASNFPCFALLFKVFFFGFGNCWLLLLLEGRRETWFAWLVEFGCFAFLRDRSGALDSVEIVCFTTQFETKVRFVSPRSW